MQGGTARKALLSPSPDPTLSPRYHGCGGGIAGSADGQRDKAWIRIRTTQERIGAMADLVELNKIIAMESQLFLGI